MRSSPLASSNATARSSVNGGWSSALQSAASCSDTSFIAFIVRTRAANRSRPTCTALSRNASAATGVTPSIAVMSSFAQRASSWVERSRIAIRE